MHPDVGSAENKQLLQWRIQAMTLIPSFEGCHQVSTVGKNYRGNKVPKSNHQSEQMKYLQSSSSHLRCGVKICSLDYWLLAQTLTKEMDSGSLQFAQKWSDCMVGRKRNFPRLEEDILWKDWWFCSWYGLVLLCHLSIMILGILPNISQGSPWMKNL